MEKEFKAKVGVVVPSGDMVHSRFMVCLISLFQYSREKNFELVIINPRSSLIATGRQMGIDMAIERNCDAILWIDSDMVFPYDTLETLWSHDKEVVGATYVKRVHPTELVHHELEGPPTIGEGIRVVRLLPAGILLTKMSAFQGLEKPYFRCAYGGGREVGEDYYFCNKLGELGKEVWLDADLSARIGHLGVYTFSIGDLNL